MSVLVSACESQSLSPSLRPEVRTATLVNYPSTDNPSARLLYGLSTSDHAESPIRKSPGSKYLKVHEWLSTLFADMATLEEDRNVSWSKSSADI